VTRTGAAIGIDVGGTFTDLVAIDAAGTISSRKVLTTPGDRSEAVVDALGPFEPRDVERIVHGTTVATNVLLERRGARVVLCATRGFGDVIALRRQDRAALYDLAAHHPPPLVGRDAVIEVDERITPDGIAVALSQVEVNRVVDAVLALAPETVAICLLHGYANPMHETMLRDAFVRRAPELDVVISSEVLPEIREYERTSTTVAEAYLRPSIARYLERLAARLDDAGFPHPAVMTSSGGMRPARDAAENAARLALSGPAGGVVGAAAMLSALDIDRALTIDIGGTSADVGLILGGRPRVEPGGAIAGVPIALPRVLVETVSAGGGSIAWIDDGGALRVGPRSSGSAPGPAAFGRGGTLPTITDAHIVLGKIRDMRLSGDITLDPAAARASLEPLAKRLNESVERVAAAIIAIADSSMARALRRLSVERGVDPRDCTLVAFGGGGPLHGCALAEQVGASRVFVPPHAGVLSAVGLAIAHELREGMTSVMTTTESLAAGTLEAFDGALRGRIVTDDDGWTRSSVIRARYAGQGHELDIQSVTEFDGPAVHARFAEEHRAVFGYTLDRPVEIVSIRHAAFGQGRPAAFARRGPPVIWNDDAPVDNGGPLDIQIEGPRSISLADATLYIGSGWRATALATGGWMLEHTSERA
jgi:N-methylhydantoinase A